MGAAGGREVWITGAGLISSLGEGLDAHWAALQGVQVPLIDAETIAPYTIHPMAAIDLDRQIAKKSDQRQMEPWQRYGVYAAGAALEDAGVKGRPELLDETQIIVAAGGGERDVAVDATVLQELARSGDEGRTLNERLMGDLRPTLFLAQLSNLLAGNIAIVHGVVGASRTFMGEEAAGFDALRVARARIAAGQGRRFLVGGSFSAQRWDLALLFELGGHARKGGFASVGARGDDDGAGFHMGSMGAFVVVEEAGEARLRGRAPVAALSHVASDRSTRVPGSVHQSLGRLWSGLADRLKPGRFAVLSCATGATGVTAEEFGALRDLAPGAPVRAVGNVVGHGVEAQFPAAVLLGAMAVRHGRLFPPMADDASERPHEGPIEQVVVTGVGHWRGEGIALVERAG